VTTRPSEETLGTFWQDEEGQIWRHTSYCEHPTASFKLVLYADGVSAQDDGEPIRKGGAVGSPILDGLTILRPESSQED
jgi:hypothetical protein